ncbi:MAG: hypothetical protein ABIO48_04890 [Pedococcus sp.]
MTALRPLPGDPGTVRALADRMAGQGELLMAMASTLRGLGDPDASSWVSPAGAAFGARSRAVASLLASVGRRYAVSAVALRPLAAALTEAQHEVTSAVAEREDAWTRAVDLGTRRVMAQECSDPVQRAEAVHLHRQEIEQLERVQQAERRHASGWARYAEADRRCAGVLHRLVQDGLDDSRAYDALTGLSRGAGAVGSIAGTLALVPVLKPLGVVAGVCDAVQLAADTVVKIGYGDGDWGTISLTAAASAIGPTSAVLKRGALATNPATRATETRTGRRLLRHDTAERLRLGVVGEVRLAGRAEGKPTSRTFRATRSPGSPTATAHWAAEQVMGRGGVLLRNKWLDDLALVTADPTRSRTMFVAGLGAETTAKGVGLVGAGRDAQLGREEGVATRARDEAAGRGATPDPGARPGGR